MTQIVNYITSTNVIKIRKIYFNKLLKYSTFIGTILFDVSLCGIVGNDKWTTFEDSYVCFIFYCMGDVASGKLKCV